MKNRFSRLLVGGLLALYAAQPALAEEPIKWGYFGDTGPKHWAELSPEYATCAKGKAQSPINIGFSQLTQLRPPQFRYKASQMELVNTGHTIQVNVEPGSVLKYGGSEYALKQLHFHTPSEHELFSRQMPMEIHFVHESQDGKLAVVAVLTRISFRPHSGLARIWQKLPQEPGDTISVSDVKHNPITLMPFKHDFVTYQGSLTTPPCSEGVTWLVMQTPIKVSAKQVERFADIVGGNARPVQALNDRKVLKRR